MSFLLTIFPTQCLLGLGFAPDSTGKVIELPQTPSWFGGRFAAGRDRGEGRGGLPEEKEGLGHGKGEEKRRRDGRTGKNEGK